MVGVPDSGGRLPLGKNEIWLAPSHFLHSEHNFHFYYAVSHILFTGDLGASMVSGAQASVPVIQPEPAHRTRVRFPQALQDVEHSAVAVGAHGAPARHFHAGVAVWRAHPGQRGDQRIFAWVENLACGIDLFDERAYQLPTEHISPALRKLAV